MELLTTRTPDPELTDELRALRSDLGRDGRDGRDRADRLFGA